ncbi:hypothetical protein ACOCJ5_10280 [Knoellia sp. CPCC 206450]|uniref:hypothetical protein n=1 Tax=Knoellia tibetensis TaxID=3404798 RepID=UPI003B42F6DB
MSILPAPFSPAVAALVTTSHRQRVRAEALFPDGTTYALEVEDYMLEWTERRSPRVEGTLSCALPDAATLEKLDPRTHVRIKVWAAYWLPAAAAWDEQLVADLHLRHRSVRRPANTVTLKVAGLEALLLDNGGYAEGASDSDTGTRTAAAYIAWMGAAILEGTPSAGVPWTVEPGGLTGEYVQAAPSNQWEELLNLAERENLDAYDDGLRHMVVTSDAVFTPPVHELDVDPDVGTLTDSDATMDRELWANHVLVRYTAPAPAGQSGELVITGTATVTGGPYTPAKSHWKQMLVERDGHPTQAKANAAARFLLRRLLSRSRGHNLEAVAAWWLRPGDTVGLTLPTGGRVLHLVSTVTFRTGGAMTLATRLPDTLTVIGE